MSAVPSIIAVTVIIILLLPVLFRFYIAHAGWLRERLDKLLKNKH